MPRPGPPYSPEFRAEAVRLLHSSGKTVAELSRELGVSQQTLRSWRRQAADERTERGDPTADEGSRFTPDPRGEDRTVQRLARLAAEAIDVGVIVVTAPARWVANGLRRYADRTGEPTGSASAGQDGGGPVAGD
jgi:transposase